MVSATKSILAAHPSPESAPVPAQVEASTETADPLVRAPMPGVITAIAVKPGQQVVRGAELCVLEAMKMKNNIRASRSGTISAVHVSLGQQVQYRDILIEFQA